MDENKAYCKTCKNECDISIYLDDLDCYQADIYCSKCDKYLNDEEYIEQ